MPTNLRTIRVSNAVLPVDDDGYPVVPELPDIRKALEAISTGRVSTDAACKLVGTTGWKLWKWRRVYPQLDDAYMTAMELAGARNIEDAVQIALNTTPETALADRLKVDTLKWAGARQYKFYGDRPSVALQINNNLEVGDAVARAVQIRNGIEVDGDEDTDV